MTVHKTIALAGTACFSIAVSPIASAEIKYDASTRIFRLTGGEAEYDIAIDEQGYLRPAYWGKMLDAAAPIKLPLLPPPPVIGAMDPPSSVTAQEYAGQGGGIVTDPGIKVAFPDGNRDLVLKYRSHRIVGNGLTIELADISRPFTVTLRYTVDPATGVVGRSAVARNGGNAPVRIDQIAAATLTLPYQPNYRLSYLAGRQLAEFGFDQQPIGRALTVLESRRGGTSNHMSPWFAIDQKGVTDEEHGPVWFGTLAWSGSWRISVGTDLIGRVRIAGGYNPYDFSWSLRPGETLETPVFYVGYSDDGMGGASRLQHRFQIASILPGNGRPKVRPVLYNSWEATEFHIDEAGQIALAEKAARIGVERFVMDDGWFGKRDSDRAGLGDWTPSPTKFPNGLGPLIDRVHKLGMEFGLWVEPEMVNPDSDLYRAHPDWVINFTGRPRTEARNQLTLNLARTDVRDHVLIVLDDLLTKNDIQYLKWDYNRSFSEPGWPEQKVEDQQRIYVEYTRNLYYILAELKKRHPKVEIESCSSGGGRVDLGIMRYTNQVWTSDNTDAFDRLTIQDGFTHAFTPAIMMAWTTDVPNWATGRNVDLSYRFLSAMQGGLGVGNNLNKWTADDFGVATRMIADYKTIRETVQTGALYRLARPDGSGPTVDTLYVSNDRRQAVLFHMLQNYQGGDDVPAIKLRGLDPDRRYTARLAGGGKLPEGVPASALGSWWMSQGVTISLRGDFRGEALILE
ncbi:alpha-galactosidase [Sphingomonas carotinifaciens]|uniref:Alpha-galactosidase n=1 Tax=Sphingomonas carotinifaciens TaxID=1166323 RepID=A0A1G7M0C3_9SPHN|nr:alpha-galactosidase [Sphingomonas carotinifaciens]MBB4086970.1 alpha-galactosidase [Sphingomonas carotinifaciens]MWC42164.1 alpha-galactosidase [Sphingomonas carotinifaciens]SDF55111.1 alpha-galactosidase [Sphingomonas carotinifaciens]